MTVERTMHMVEEEMACGDLGKARDRLHGLVAAYPVNLSLRRKLGDVYDKLQYPAMAGRYWYLEENKTPAMMAACELYEKSCGNDSLQILRALKFKGELDSVESEFARKRLESLRSRVLDEHGLEVDFNRQGADKYRRTRKSKVANGLSTIGCVILILAAVALMVIGAITIYGRVF